MQVMRRAFALGCLPLAAATICLAPNLAGAEVLFEVLRESCVHCHGKLGEPSGNVNLFELRSAADLTRNPELIHDLVRALDLGIMPPAGQPPLTSEKRWELVSELRGLLHVAVAAQKVLPQSPIRRMNRFQYNNAVQDLFDLQVDVFALPERMLREYGYFRPESGKVPESLKAGSRPLGKSQLIDKRLAGVAPFPQDLRAEHGFDNRGDHLTLSPLLLESFLKLSRSIVESEDFNATTSGAWEELFAPGSGEREIEAEVRERLRPLLTRAFRRPVDEESLGRYVDYALTRIASGNSFTEGMKAAASAALASPRFLYLYEQAGAGDAAERLNDYELASRLSFFLWGSIPDRTLLDLAGEGKLGDPAVLRAQADRMLKDRRVKRFCDSFAPQWLQLERIVSSVPDRERFPDFYLGGKFRASMHMMLEPLLLFETILIEDRSVLELVDSDFTYRSELLESWYRDSTRPQHEKFKVPGGSDRGAILFRRVAVTDRRQGGVITNAAVMTMTSNPVRTQPITRGAWIAGVVFNNPPDPPPPSVTPLPEQTSEEADSDLTLRERLEAHRTQAECAGCHAKIDPLGFALENYGPTGVWRDVYENGRKVDSSGVLFGRREFGNIVELKDAILAEPDRFARAFAGHLLAFALGRQAEVSDEPALDRIVRETANADYSIQETIRQVVLSKPFRTKYNPVEPEKR